MFLPKIAFTDQHATEFLGASQWDDKPGPFIVMQYLHNGNARDYVREHPDCNRLMIVRDFLLYTCLVDNGLHTDMLIP
jgi:hypothetical protein